jgi:hypothetical protein
MVYPRYYFLKYYNISIKEQILAGLARLKKFGYNPISSEGKGVYYVSYYNDYYVGVLYSKSTYRKLANRDCSTYYRIRVCASAYQQYPTNTSHEKWNYV